MKHNYPLASFRRFNWHLRLAMRNYGIDTYYRTWCDKTKYGRRIKLQLYSDVSLGDQEQLADFIEQWLSHVISVRFEAGALQIRVSPKCRDRSPPVPKGRWKTVKADGPFRPATPPPEEDEIIGPQFMALDVSLRLEQPVGTTRIEFLAALLNFPRPMPSDQLAILNAIQEADGLEKTDYCDGFDAWSSNRLCYELCVYNRDLNRQSLF